MKITKTILSKLGIHNPHNLASKGDEPQVFVDYQPAENGWAARFAQWYVGRVGYQTDSKRGHWHTGYNKIFTVYNREEKEPQRLVAVEWASNRYNIAEWEKSPFGSYHPKGTLAKATKEQEAERK